MTIISAPHVQGPIERAIVGTFFHVPTPRQLEVLADTMIVIGGTGAITAIFGPDHPERAAMEAEAESIVRLPAGTYVLPDMVDLHVHAPQYPQLGLALDEPLEVRPELLLRQRRDHPEHGTLDDVRS